MPVLLVGGGSILVDCEVPLKGASKVIVPSEHWVRVKRFTAALIKNCTETCILHILY